MVVRMSCRKIPAIRRLTAEPVESHRTHGHDKSVRTRNSGILVVDVLADMRVRGWMNPQVHSPGFGEVFEMRWRKLSGK